MRHLTGLLLTFLALPALAQTTQPADGIGRFPHIEVDVKKREVRIDCEALNPTMALEFFCVLTGTSEHEAVLRTAAKPAQIHTGLLMLGAKPGRPARYDEGEKRWLPPTGEPLDLFVELPGTNGKPPTRHPAAACIRDLKTKKPLQTLSFVFAGSRTMPDGTYAADATGYVASLVNFDFTLMDVPRVASNSNETLEYEFNPDIVPARGTKVTLVIRPTRPPTTQPAKQ